MKLVAKPAHVEPSSYPRDVERLLRAFQAFGERDRKDWLRAMESAAGPWRVGIVHNDNETAPTK